MRRVGESATRPLDDANIQRGGVPEARPQFLCGVYETRCMRLGEGPPQICDGQAARVSEGVAAEVGGRGGAIGGRRRCGWDCQKRFQRPERWSARSEATVW